MELKTKVNAVAGGQDVEITRDFELPVHLLFKAHTDPEFLAQWMGTKVIKLESKKHGSYQFETEHLGNIVFRASGVIHDLIPEKKITRTFEMDNAPFGVQLEVYQFEPLTDDTSRLRMHVIYESAALRDQVMKLPFAQGLNMAHDRIQQIFGNKK